MRPLVRRISGALIGACLVLGTALHLPLPAPDMEPAADLRQFRPGNIIADALFYDGLSMDAAAVQSFLDGKGRYCVPGADGTPCLKNYSQDTPTRLADSRCGLYAGAPGESAATIIAKVGRACGISPRVILVMLQKEQGLVLGSGAGLYATRYRSAMGYRCPDTAPCDSQYYGFFNQVYSAARQFKNYAARPGDFGHRAGMVNQVRFSPTLSCGSSPVFIENVATAGLYNYTPYQPNAAALAAGTGTGDGCSAYGNRNFWNHFTNWFGSTQSVGGTAIMAAAEQAGGAATLGSPITGIVCGMLRAGCGQAFQAGSIYWSPSTQAQVVWGGVYATFRSLGYETGVLGYPTSAEVPTEDGVGRRQFFQGGAIYWSPGTGASYVSGAIQARWLAAGGATGSLGYPVTHELRLPDGVGRVSYFQRGAIFWSPSTGAHAIGGGILAAFRAAGLEGGPLGYPVTGESAAAAGARSQEFRGGSIYWSESTGAHAVWGGVRASWLASGGAGGVVGLPITGELDIPGKPGRYQDFVNGSAYWSPRTGARIVGPAVKAIWSSSGGATGPLGLPSTDEFDGPGDSRTQVFQGGQVVRTSADGRVVWGGIYAAWVGVGGLAGPLGIPTSAEEPDTRQGRVQRFSGGLVSWSGSTGAHVVWGAIGHRWAATGGVDGPLGYPTSPERSIGSGRVQTFQGGSVYWSGGTGAHLVTGAIAATWQAYGGATGALGFPTSDELPGPGTVGRVSHFEGAVLYWSPAARTRLLTPAVLAAYTTAGGEAGRLGAPTSDRTSTSSGGHRVDFVGGWIDVDSSGRAQTYYR